MNRGSVRRMVRHGDVAGLCAVLELRELRYDRRGVVRDPAVGLRTQAVSALAELPGEPAAIGLGRAASDLSASVRSVAVVALGERGETAATANLAAAIVQWPADDLAGREIAADVLVHTGDPEATLELVDALLLGKDEVEDLRPLFDRLLLDAPPKVQQRCQNTLLHTLHDRNPLRARTAATVLAWLAGTPLERLVEVFHQARTNPERVRIIRSLGRTHDRAASAVLAQFIESPEPELRRAAATALGTLADPRSIDVLIRATDDGDHGVRVAAIAAVDALGSVAVIAGVAHSVRTQVAGLDARMEQFGALVERVEEAATPRRELSASDEPANGAQPHPLDALSDLGHRVSGRFVPDAERPTEPLEP